MKARHILLCLLIPCLPIYAQQGPQDLHPFFSPNGGCTQAVVDQLNAAKKTVLVQAYSFTSAPIAKALVDAMRRGVDVRVILDKSQKSERYTSATFLANEGVPTYIDSRHKIAHNKVMIIDGHTVITGSFNFTKSAEEGNAENLLVINNAPQLAARYTDNWKLHLGHSFQY
jgi:phosphatidylserine/phosphatidylglycerophosphate/cardiolipin synthase-like enzyme